MSADPRLSPWRERAAEPWERPSERRSRTADDRAPAPLQWLILALSALSITLFAIAEADGAFRWIHGIWLVAQLALVLGGSWGLRQLVGDRAHPPAVSPLLVALGLLPVVAEPIRRMAFGAGMPFELLTLSVLRNVILGLALLSPWKRFHAITLALSLFLVLFSVITSSDPAVRLLAGLFATTAVAWLAASHWDELRQRLTTRQARSRPRWGGVVVGSLVVAGLLWLSGGERLARATLRGVLASSGGTGQQDPFSRDGVGDGEMLVAGSERIQSFAPIENAPFVSDHEPSLYDVFDDTYEEQVTRPKDQDRAVGLPPELSARIQDHLRSRVEKANREFSTRRQPGGAKAGSGAPNIASDALFHVAGRVPLHLRLQPYDLFDGTSWYPQRDPESRPPLEMTTVDERPWLSLPDRVESRRYLGAAESHALKIVRLDTNVIPAPLNLHGIHIDQVAQADMYRWGPDGLVRLDRKRLPPLVPIHVLSRTVDAARIGSDLSVYSTLGPAFRDIPDAADPPAIARLAQDWTRTLPRGWPQVEAVRQRLRSEYQLDPQARPAEDARCPVHEFLFRSRRGPDYQFATAAALLLRSLGYSTRVVSGFYASPARYDSSARHTPVLAGDVHFWTEVNVGGSDWLTMEASPGYEVLGPAPGLWQRVCTTATSMAGLVVRHAILTGSLLAVAVVAFLQRTRLADGIDLLRWRLTRHRPAGGHVLATLRLVERRSRRGGQGRPAGMTAGRWLAGELAREAPELSGDLGQLRSWVDAALYSRDGIPLSSSEIAPVSDRVVTTLSTAWFRQRARARPAKPMAT